MYIYTLSAKLHTECKTTNCARVKLHLVFVEMVNFMRSVWENLHRAQKIYTGDARGAREKYEVCIQEIGTAQIKFIEKCEQCIKSRFHFHRKDFYTM